MPNKRGWLFNQLPVQIQKCQAGTKMDPPTWTVDAVEELPKSKEKVKEIKYKKQIQAARHRTKLNKIEASVTARQEHRKG